MENDQINLRSNYERTGRNLYKGMNALLLPSFLTMAASSLNEFVDSILMSNLLDSTALAVISYCFCIMLFYGMLQCLFGYGGSVIYARLIGSKKRDSADSIFAKSMCTSALISLAVMAAGLLFRANLAGLLCHDATLSAQMNAYLLPTILAAPLCVVLNTLSCFLPVLGMPNLSMAIVIIANVVNLFLDYVYVTFFHMGVEGAGWATITGYAVSCLYLLVLIIIGKCRLTFRFSLFTDIKELGNVIVTGLPQGLFQICVAVQSVYGNSVSSSLGGQSGMVAFSLQMQLQSMVSVVLSGINSTMMSFVAVLHAQEDHTGIKYIIRRCVTLMSVFTVVVFVLLQLWPRIVLGMYGISGDALSAVAITAVRIFAVTYIFRSISMLLRTHMNAIGFNYYATGISMTDSLLGILLWSAVLIPVFGLTGLWIAFPVNAVFLLAGILLINMVYSRRHPEYRGILLLKQDASCLDFLNITIEDSAEPISEVSLRVQEFCARNYIDKRQTVWAGLLVEEMCVFTKAHNRKNLFIDIMVRCYEHRIQIDFRSLGQPADPLAFTEEDTQENIRILRGFASKLEYDYSLGMNSTKITINE